jgi:hypothetical protein
MVPLRNTHKPDQIADEGIFHENAFSNLNNIAEAHPHIFFEKLSSHSGVYRENQPLPTKPKNMSESKRVE